MWDLSIHLPSGPASSLALVLFSNRCGTSQSTPFGTQCPCWHTTSFHPLQSSTSSLAYQPVFDSDPICNKPKPTTSRDCPLWAFPFGLPLKVFKTRLLERSFHTFINNASFSSPTNVGSHKTHTHTRFINSYLQIEELSALLVSNVII